MSGFEEERKAIETRFLDNFVALGASRIKLQNVRFDQPSSGTWVALIILPGELVGGSIGSVTKLRRWVGYVQIDCYAAEATGTAAVRELADAAGAVFEDVTVSAGTDHDIIFGTPQLQTYTTNDRANAASEHGWYRMTVSIPYRRHRVT